MRILRGKWALSLVFGPARGPDRVAPIANDVLEVGRFVDDFKMPLAAPFAQASFFESRIVGGHVAPESENHAGRVATAFRRLASKRYNESPGRHEAAGQQI